MKHPIKLLFAVLVGAALSGGNVCGAEMPDRDASAEIEKPVKVRKLPIQGRVIGFDVATQVVSIGGAEDRGSFRDLYVTEETEITKEGEPVNLEELEVGEIVRGSYIKREDGKFELATLKLGAKKKGDEESE